MAESLRCEFPLCGAQAAKRWRREGPWRIVRCPWCGVLITWPRPDDGTLARFYEGAQYYDERHGSVGCRAVSRSAAALLAALPVHSRRVLDVGAGQGH